MHHRQLLDGSLPRPNRPHPPEQPGLPQRINDHFQPLGTFEVDAARVVIELSSIADPADSHGFVSDCRRFIVLVNWRHL